MFLEPACSYIRYKLYCRYEYRFPDCSYNRHPLYIICGIYGGLQHYTIPATVTRGIVRIIQEPRKC